MMVKAEGVQPSQNEGNSRPSASHEPVDKEGHDWKQEKLKGVKRRKRGLITKQEKWGDVEQERWEILECLWLR